MYNPFSVNSDKRSNSMSRKSFLQTGRLTFLLCGIFCMSMTFTATANPVEPLAVPLFYEYMVISPGEWYLEISLADRNTQMAFQQLQISPPCSTDVFGAVQSSDLMVEPQRKIWLDTISHSICVISYEQFPDFKPAESFVFYCIDRGTYFKWDIAFNAFSDDSSYILLNKGYTGTSRYYKTSHTSIGKDNGSTEGTVTGIVKDNTNNPLGNIVAANIHTYWVDLITGGGVVSDTFKTTTKDGLFSLSLHPFDASELQFYTQAMVLVSNKIIYPKVIPYETVDLGEIVLDDYVTISNKESQLFNNKNTLKIVQTFFNRGNNSIRISFIDECCFHRDFTVNLFSVKGSKIYSKTLNSIGPGTYSCIIPGVSSGKYIVSICSGEQKVYKKISF